MMLVSLGRFCAPVEGFGVKPSATNYLKAVLDGSPTQVIEKGNELIGEIIVSLRIARDGLPDAAKKRYGEQLRAFESTYSILGTEIDVNDNSKETNVPQATGIHVV